MQTPKICVIIPAYNEELSIQKVIRDIPNIVHTVVVVNNASSDNTLNLASKAGATVITENKKGYGAACLKGIDFLNKHHPNTQIVVFLDADYADFPEQLIQIVQPIIHNNLDFVVGARTKELREKNSMTFQQIFGNYLATFLMQLLFKSTFTDLGPFRAIKFNKLKQLNMCDTSYG